MHARPDAKHLPLDCPRCGQSDEHELAALRRAGMLTCAGCGGVFRVDSTRLERMATALLSVEAMLGRWSAAERK